MPAGDNDTNARPNTPWKAGVAAYLGSATEFYDFCIFGTASALIFSKIFFPQADTAAALLMSFVTLALGYLARPIGAVLLGHMGDKYGRKRVFVLSLLTMGVGTFLVGCLPTYDQVGWLAPALLLFLRVGQGLAASGQQSSSIGMALEHAPEKRRAFFTSLSASGFHAGSVLATAVFVPILALPDAQLLQWGWRIPFWLGSCVALVGYFVKRELRETPVFEAVCRSGTVVRMPLLVLCQRYSVDVLRVMCCSLVAMVSVIFTVYALSYAVNIAKMDRETVLLATVSANVIGLFVIPLWAILADRIGRKPVFLIGAIGSPLGMFCYLWAIEAHDIPLVFGFGIVSSGIAYSAFGAVWPSFFNEMFDARVRLSGAGIGMQIGFAVAGCAPALAVAFPFGGADTWLPGACLCAGACGIAAISALTARETYDVPIDACGRETRASG